MKNINYQLNARYSKFDNQLYLQLNTQYSKFDNQLYLQLYSQLWYQLRSQPPLDSQLKNNI
jgi:hypothetical protein